MTSIITQPIIHPSRTEVQGLAKMMRDHKVGVLLELADRLGWGVTQPSARMIRLAMNGDRVNWMDLPMTQDCNDNVWESWVKKIKRYAVPNRLQRFDVDAFLLEVKLDSSHAHYLEDTFGSKRKRSDKERLDNVTPIRTVTDGAPTSTPGVLVDSDGIFRCADCKYTHARKIGVIGHRAGKHNPDAIARRVATRKQNDLVKQAEAEKEARHQREIERKREYRRRKKAEKEQVLDDLADSSRDQEIAAFPGRSGDYLNDDDHPDGLYRLDSLHDFAVAIEHIINVERHRRTKGLEDALAAQMERAEAAERRADAAERKLADVAAAIDMLREAQE